MLPFKSRPVTVQSMLPSHLGEELACLNTFTSQPCNLNKSCCIRLIFHWTNFVVTTTTTTSNTIKGMEAKLKTGIEVACLVSRYTIEMSFKMDRILQILVRQQIFFIKAEDKLEEILAQLVGLGVEFNVLVSSSFLVEILEQWRGNMWHKLFELVEW